MGHASDPVMPLPECLDGPLESSSVMHYLCRMLKEIYLYLIKNFMLSNFSFKILKGTTLHFACDFT